VNHLWLAALLLAAASQFQLFSLEQDIAIGSVSANEADRTLPLIRGVEFEGYVRSIGRRLTSPSPNLRYDFRIVNSTAINASTFPGGTIYLERGLIELTENEHELAALLAHEMAHAARRHGTRQLSGQLLVQAPASVLAGLPTNERWIEQLTRLGISLGVQAPFLRYSPEQEIEANTLAVEMLVSSIYSPYALPAIQEKINTAMGTESRSLPAYAYNHPLGLDASARLDTELARHKLPQRLLRPSPEFLAFQKAMSRLAFPPVPAIPEVEVSDLPREYRHPENYYSLRHPEGWQVRPTSDNGAMIAPVGGVQATSAGGDLRTGIMFDLFPLPEQKMPLDQATNRLIVVLRQRNQDLKVIPGAQSQMLMGTEPAIRTVLTEGSRPSDSFVWIATRYYFDTLFYIVCVAPQDEFAALQPTFEQIIRSVDLR
jgi:Zn-dependent protease with chaperone function